MPAVEDQDDLLDILDDADTPPDSPAGPPWHVLLVDDEPSVLAATRYALRDVSILGRPLDFLTAGGLEEALALLRSRPDVAVAVLDVVMEEHDSGLKLVEAIRALPQGKAMRIIIRTGQPGYAPELEVIHRYDINDYRTKGEMDRTRLVTTLTAAIRAYHQISLIDAHRAGLEKVVQATGSLLAERSLTSFADGVLTQICQLAAIQPEGVLIVRLGTEEQGRVIAAAGRFAGLVGAPMADVPAEVAAWLDAAARGDIRVTDQAGGLRVLSPNGDELLVHFVISGGPRQVDTGLLRLFASNVAVGFDNVRLHEELSRAAFTDTATGLPNRAGWLRAARAAGLDRVMVMRVPELHTVRLLFGAAAAGVAASSIGAVLSNCVNGPVGLITPTLFALPAQVGTEIDIAAQVTDAGLTVGGVALRPTTVLAVAGGPDPEQALNEAMVALPLAIPQGPPVHYTGDMGQLLVTRVNLLSDLEAALREERVHVHLQPQVRLDNGALVGAEALVRWAGPDGRFIPPATFIPLAEETGLILSLGRRVAMLAAAIAGGWSRLGRDLRLSVNVSPRELLSPDLAPALADLAASAGLPVSRFMIEITESAFTSDDGALLRSVEALARAGFPLSIDDFGTGHSSLARLAWLPVAELKLDRSLCGHVDSDARSRRVAGLVTDLGRDLGITVLAEGIETESQAAVLRDLGCELAQGYLFGKPMPLHSFESCHPGFS